MTKNMENIADKIRKIIAKADSTTNPEEADTFMTKAHAMLQAHGLSLLDLGKLDSDNPIGVDKFCTKVSAAYACSRIVAHQLAKYYGCDLVSSVQREGKLKINSFSVAGRESARVTFQLMFPFVWRQTMALAREGFNSGGYNNRMQALTFVGNALAMRLYQLNKGLDAERKASAPGSGVNQLVPVDLIQQAMREAFPNLTQGKGRSISTNEKSRALAAKVSLNRQTTASAGARRIGA